MPLALDSRITARAAKAGHGLVNLVLIGCVNSLRADKRRADNLSSRAGQLRLGGT